MDSFKALFFVYLFIAIAFISKKIFKEKISESSLVLLSVYIFQPFLTFWGLLKRPLDFNLALSPVVFFLLSLLVVMINIAISKKLFKDSKESSIFIVSSVIGNTGNLGVPLGLALFGEESLPYTTIINLANVFMVYSFGAYFYSRGSFDVKKSIKNTLKLPILWFALLALLLNLSGFKAGREFELFLQMGSYTAIVLQLFIFGAYLAKVSIKHIEIKLTFWVTLMKFLLLPLIAFISLKFIPLEPLAKRVIFMEMVVPLAVANVNLAALYQCKELAVTSIVFISSLLFLFLLPFYISLIGAI